MWLFTKHGFYSVVCARQDDGSHGQPVEPDRIMVRARVHSHVEALIDRFSDLLADALKPECDVKGDNLSLVFPKSTSLDEIAGLISAVDLESVRPIPNIEAMENLKFSECLSPDIAAEVFTSRFDDRKAVTQALHEQRQVIVSS